MSNVLTNLTISVDPKGAVSGLNKVKNSFSLLTAASNKSTDNIRRQFNTLNKGFDIAKVSIIKLANLITNVLSDISTRIAVVFGFSELVDAARKIEKFETTFLTFTGTLRIARKEIDILLGVTNKFGVAFEAAIIPFAKFAAATQDMAKSDIRNIFTSFIEASSALQLNMQEVNGVFLALQQIASKGRVSMEELRLQLAERIPGTMIIAANAMKMTMMEFEKSCRLGTINVNEFLMKFADGIHNKFGAAAALAADRLFAKMNRLNNALLFFKNRLFTTGIIGKAYSSILEDITKKLMSNELATGAISNVLGALLTKIEKIMVSIKPEDINGWINSFTVFTKTIGITIDAIWNLSTALLSVLTLGTGNMALKLLRWPFDLAAAFDLARDGLLDFKDIMAASSFDELHTLVADAMTVDQGLQKLRVTYVQLENQLTKLQSKMSLKDIITSSKPELAKEITRVQKLLYEMSLLIEEKEKLVGPAAIKGDPQLINLSKQYEDLEKVLHKLQRRILRVKEDGTIVSRKWFDFDLSKDIRQVQDQLYSIQLLIDKRKEYFSIKPEGEEIDTPTSIVMPPSMAETERAAKIIASNIKLMQRGYDDLLSTHDRTIKHLTDSYKEYADKIQTLVSKDLTKNLGVLTQEEADKYIKEMEVFTDAMLKQAEKLEKIKVLGAFNSSLQEAKNRFLPDYIKELNKVDAQFKVLSESAKKAAITDNWDTDKIKAVNDEINNLKKATISLLAVNVFNKFNSSLQDAKDIFLPDYQKELNNISEQFKVLAILAEEAAIANKWSPEEIKIVTDEIEKLKDATISLSNIKILDNFNLALKEIKDSLLPDYQKEINSVNEQFKVLTILAEKAAIANKWDTDEIKAAKDEIDNLKDSVISLSNIKIIDNFNSALKIAKDKFLPDYQKEINIINEQFKVLAILAEKAAISNNWSTEEIKLVADEIEKLKNATISLVEVDLSPMEQAYMDLYTSMGVMSLTVYDLLKTQYKEDRDAFIEATNDKATANDVFAKKMDKLNADMNKSDEKTTEEKLKITATYTGMMASTFETLANLGGKHSKKMFKAFKVLKIAETLISSYSGAMKAYEEGGTYMGPAMAAIILAFGAAQVAAIQAQEPPSYDMGGISRAGGLYQTGNIDEAHIPIPSGGKIPVQIKNEVPSKLPMSIHIHEAEGTQSRVEESDDGMTLDIIIEQVEQKMAGRMNRGAGLASFMDNRYSRTY